MNLLRKTPLLGLMLLLIGLLMFSCKKANQNRSLHVQLVEAGTQKPLQNFKVDMYYFKAGSTLFNGSTLLYATAYTDADGKVFVDGSEYDPVQLRIYAPEPGKYYDARLGGGYYISVPLLKGDNPVVKFYPYAWLGLHVDFSIYNGEFDYVSYYYGPNAGGDIYKNDTIMPQRVQGNRNISVNFYGIKNGQQIKTWQNEVYCPGFDTTYFVPTYPTN
jgi:hypothetical protein